MADSEQLYAKWVQLWNGDTALAQEIIASDFVFHRGNQQPDWHGPAEVAQEVEKSRSLFEELTFTTKQGPITTGEWLVGRNEAQGTYRGGMPGATLAAGSSVRLVGIDLLRVSHGKIVEAWHNSNDLEFMLQLGLVEYRAQ